MKLKEILNNSIQETKILEAIKYNFSNNLSLIDCQYRPGSEMFKSYFDYLRENRNKFSFDDLEISLLESGLGDIAEYKNEVVSLNIPFIDLNESNENIELNTPKRGGSKKFFVYVKDPKTGKVKKVSFGANGRNLSVKFNDENRRKSFVARHKCEEKNDITTPGYWSCNLPKYAAKLGLKGGGNFFW